MGDGLTMSPFNGMKCLVHSDKIKEILNGEIPAPVTVEIDSSNFCNHNCIWCMYKNFRAENKDMISFNKMMEICDDLVEMGVKSVTFTGGGEPLTNDATSIAMRRLHDAGVKVGLVTNGGLLNKENNIEAVLDTCRFLRVSLDAATDETHQKLHGTKNNDEYTRIMENVLEIYDRRNREKLEIGYGFLVHPLNFKEIDLAVENAQRCFDYIQIRPVLGPKISYEIANYVNNRISEHEKTNTDDFKVYGILHRFDELMFKNHGFDKCRATPLVGVVGADLKLYLCCQWRGEKRGIIGDISNKRFKEEWGSDKHKEVINSIDINECVPCRYKIYNQAIENAFIKDSMHKDFL
jgi:wyosine [tRNA(Phe)-imidazoG37] synthetase (radical SAM superfamily)